MAAACAAHPERFIRAIPQPPALPTAVWIQPASHRGGQHSIISDARCPMSRQTPTRGVDGWVAPLWWTDGVGQAVPSHLRLRRT